jgi:hypothetical protein
LPKKSIAIELLKFSSFLLKNVTKAAITKARAKLSPDAFKEVNYTLVKEFYTDNNVKKFYGFNLVAIDGSLMELPLNSPSIKEKYGTISNQTDYEKPMARSSSAFDLLNGITLDAILDPYTASEKDLAIRHIQQIVEMNLQHSFLFIFDRGYPSLELIIYLIKNGVNFVMRSNTKFLKEVNEVVVSGKKDVVIKIKAKKLRKEAWKKLKELFPDLTKNDCFSLRVVLVQLKTGETEILLTSLLQKTDYPYKIFKDLYFKRWGIEENYDFKKNVIEIENFSGKSCLAVEQDFHAAGLIGNVHAILAFEAENEIKDKGKENFQKHQYKINKNVSLAVLKDNLIEVLIDPKMSLENFCKIVKQIMKRNLVPIRPGRSYPRRKKHYAQKYHMSQR